MSIVAAFLGASLAMTQASVAHASTEPLVAEAVVDAPADKVWDAFTTKEGIESWMVASGDVDLRIGGLMRTTYRRGADLDGETAIHQTILSIDPGRMLSFRTIKSPKDFPFAEAISKSWTVVYLDPVEIGRTRVTVKMLGYDSDPESQKMRRFFELGNKATLDALVKRFVTR
jgi:uncharacterized protein YndB with AHSA1/START domain